MAQEESQLLSIQEVAALYGVSVRAMWDIVAEDAFPAPVRVGKRSTRWHRREVLSYLSLLPRTARPTPKKGQEPEE